MNSDDWTRVDAILAGALTISASHREAYVRKACEGDEELHNEIRRLIAAAEAAEARFGGDWGIGSHLSGEALLDALDPPLDAGDRIGPYELVRRIGRGGMGSVYLAERADGQFERQVALKVVGTAVLRQELLARFLKERQILASLQHPGIAQLYTGGFTADGRPYFAMEYVEGQPITEFCDRRSLNVRDRLQLFRDVGQAVQYAHRNLVIHRDLKPSNILVTDAGAVKLLDFGIAKLLEEDRSPDATATGLPLMTPGYASPEQVLGQRMTTASDVYQLGVLLYELLTGRTPHSSEGRTLFEVQRAIVDDVPLPPSKVVHADAPRGEDGPSPVALARATTWPALERALRGDLDTLVLKALEKEPERRYGSVSALLADADRHVEGLPLVARPSTVPYRVTKFVRRHRLGVATAGLFLILLSSYAVTVTSQAQEIRRERNRAELERDRALREQATAEQVAAVFADLFESTDPYAEGVQGGAEVRVRDVLDRGAVRVREELAGEPEVQAELLNVLGTVYQNLGQYDEAEALYREELAVRNRTGDQPNPETAEALGDLAYVLQERGEMEESETLFRQSLDMQRAVLDRTDPAIAVTLTRLGGLLWFNKGDFAGADSAFRQALEIRRASLDRESSELTSSLNSMATLLQRQGDYEGAEPLYREAVELYREQLGEHPNVAIVQSNFASLLRDKGDYEEAVAVARRALAMHRELQGARNIDVALGLGTLGSIFLEQGRIDEAEAMLREALVMQLEFFDESHPYALRTRLHIARLHAEQGRLQEAEATVERLIEAYAEALPEDHFAQADPRTLLGRIRLADGEPSLAEPPLREAMAIREAAFPETHWRVAEARGLLGQALAAQGGFEAAEPFLAGAAAALESQRGLQDPYAREATLGLVRLYEAWGRPERAAAHLARLDRG